MILPKHILRAWIGLNKTGRAFYQDNGLFLAMGLAFNLLLYFVPLILLMISVLGYTVLELERAMAEVQSAVQRILPHSEPALADNLASIISNRGLLGLAGFVFFLIFSSTLFSSVRHVLNIIFKAEHMRSFLRGIGHDFLMMLITALVLVLAPYPSLLYWRSRAPLAPNSCL